MSQAAQFSFIQTPESQAAKLIVPADQDKKLEAGGAAYQAGFISPEEEAALIAAIDKENWIGDIRRRVQHYGYRYDYTKRNLSVDDKIGALPQWADSLCQRFVQDGTFDGAPPDQLIVNEYEPGQGIAPHADRDCFGAVLAGVSLASDCLMDIYPNPKNKKADSFPITLERRSLLVMSGESREKWLHGIRPNKSDTQDEQKVPRTRRISLTFRTVLV